MMNAIIEARSISFSYPNSKKNILDNCSFVIREGDMVSLLGPNGAGKSTLLNCLCGLLTPQKGSIFIDGKNIKKLSNRDVSMIIGYVQQYQDSVFAHSVFDYVLMGRARRVGLFQKPTMEDQEIVRQVLDETGILHLADMSITEISGGERQQAAIARAIVQQPKVIFFDEPTAHLDYGNQVRTLKSINDLRKKGFTIVMTTHTPDHCIMLGGKVIIIDKTGAILKGDGEKLITQEMLQALYKTDLKLVYVKEAGRKVCIPETI